MLKLALTVLLLAGCGLVAIPDNRSLINNLSESLEVRVGHTYVIDRTDSETEYNYSNANIHLSDDHGALTLHADAPGDTTIHWELADGRIVHELHVHIAR